MQSLIELPLSAERLLAALLERGRVRESEAPSIVGENWANAATLLIELGLARREENYLEPTEATKAALAPDRLGPPVMLALAPSSVELHKPSTRTRRQLEARGLVVTEGYLLKGTPPAKPKPRRDELREAWELLREGKTRYAALKAYKLAKNLGDQLLREAKENLASPTPASTAQLLARIQRELQKPKRIERNTEQ